MDKYLEEFIAKVKGERMNSKANRETSLKSMLEELESKSLTIKHWPE